MAIIFHEIKYTYLINLLIIIIIILYFILIIKFINKNNFIIKFKAINFQAQKKMLKDFINL